VSLIKKQRGLSPTVHARTPPGVGTPLRLACRRHPQGIPRQIKGGAALFDTLTISTSAGRSSSSADTRAQEGRQALLRTSQSGEWHTPREAWLLRM